MIQFNNITLTRGAKIIVESANATLFPNEKIGLIGLNGAGKSSLLAALLGEIGLDQGQIDRPASWKMAWIEQEVLENDQSVLDFALQGDRELAAVLKAIEQATASDQHTDLSALYEQLDNLDGYTAQARIASILHGLGFSTHDLQRKVGEFSGGWKMRMNLARVLGSRADLILLDEPTNHLDIDAVLWLEQWITQLQGTVIVVSHDRDFLDEICTHTLHLHGKTLTKYTGNYSTFERTFAERNEQIVRQNRKSADQIERLQRFVDRFKAKATKAKQAQSRVKRLEKIKLIDTLAPNPSVQLSFLEPHKSPDPLVVLNQADCGYSDKTILRNVRLELRPGDRIGLLGSNGNGKTTLIKSLVGQLALLEGERVEGKGLVCGYFAQNQIESLDPTATPLQHFVAQEKGTPEQQLREFLARFHFTGDKVNQTIGDFSGGEKSRLALALLARKKPNLLLLDEPTNHLDIDTRQALAEALIEFEGALIVVSHDRHLLESITDTYWKVADGQVELFDGDLNDYARLLKQNNQTNQTNQTNPYQATEAPSQATRPTTQSANQPNASQSNHSTDPKLRQQQRQQDHARLKQARNEQKKLEKQIEDLSETLNALDKDILNLDYSKPLDQVRAATLNVQRQTHAEQHEHQENQLLDLMLEIETLEQQLGL